VLYVWGILLILVNVVWLFLTLIGLPGNWLIVLGAALYAWLVREADGTPAISLWALVAILVLALLGELFEFIAGYYGSRRVGGSRGGAIGAIIGGIVGGLLATPLIPIPIVGSIVGACLGAAAGALIMEIAGGRDWDSSFRSGVGAGVGRFWGTIGKFGVGVAMFLVIAVAVFV
jgi:hypothetical protein